MIKLLPILFMSIILSAELEVDGNLTVTGTIQASTIDSLLSLIAQLEQRIAQLECQNTGIIPDGYCDCFFHILDACGVCNGDHSSCEDCAGVPNGDNLQDMCGYCDNDSSNDCVQDCNGEWGGTVLEDVCGVCGGDAESEDECEYTLSFNGVDNYVRYDGLNDITENHAFTISAEISIQNLQGTFRSVVSLGDKSGQGHIENTLCISEENVMRWNNQHGQNDCRGTTILNENQFYHALVTYSDSGGQYGVVALYLDGQFELDCELGGHVYFDGNGIVIGARIRDNGGSVEKYFSGLIDNVIIWDTNLSAIEIMGDLNQTKVENIIARYNFNTVSENILYDQSPNLRNGILYNSPTWVVRD